MMEATTNQANESAEISAEYRSHIQHAEYLHYALQVLAKDDAPAEKRAELEAWIGKTSPLHWALVFARTYRIVPVWPTVAGACTCDAGASCRNRGRHLMVKGLRESARTSFGANLDREGLDKVVKWWTAAPRAGVALALDDGYTAIRGTKLLISDNPEEGFSLVRGTLAIFNAQTEETEMVVSLDLSKELPDDLGSGLDVRHPGDFVVVHDHEKTIAIDTFAPYPVRAPKWLTDLAHSAPKAACDPSMVLSASPPPVHWLCRDLGIAPGRPTVVSGAPGAGKSPLAQGLAVSVATGRPFLGMPVRQERVAWCAFEAAQVTHVNLQRLARGADVDPAELAIDAWPFRAKLNDKGTMAELRRRVRAEGYGLVIIDSYTSALRNVDHNSSSFGDALRQLEKLSDETGAVVLVLMHVGKKSEAAGSREIAGHFSAVASAQTVINLTRPEKSLTKFRVSCSRSLFSPFDDFDVEFRDVHRPPTMETPAWGLSLKRCDHGGVDEFVLTMLGAMPGLNQGQVVQYAKGQGHGRNETVEALRALENTGAVRVDKTNKSTGHRYFAAAHESRAA